MRFNTFIETYFTATRLEQQQHIYILGVFLVYLHIGRTSIQLYRTLGRKHVTTEHTNTKYITIY